MTVEELAAYSHDQLEPHPVQYTPQMYVDQFRRRLQGKRVFFNGWALLTGGIWMLYRKMYGVGAAVFLLEHALILTSHWAFIVFRIGLALFATPLYFAAAQKVVDRSRREGLNVEERFQKLRARGGTSRLMAILALVGSLILRTFTGALF